MGYSIQSRPSSVNGVAKSSFTAARNPVLYKFRREDSAWNQINDNGGFIQVQINGVNSTAYFQVGNRVWVGAATTQFFGNITASAFSGGNTLLTIDVAYSSITGIGNINNMSKRTDFKIKVQLHDFITSTFFASMGNTTFSFSPNPIDQIIYIDLSSILRKLVRAEWVNPSAVIETDTEASVKFYIRHQEYFDGALQLAATNDNANPIIAVNAAMQIYYAEKVYGHGGNLLSYLVNDEGRGWLTRFYVNSVMNKMRIWRGYPFTLSFIRPSTFAGALNKLVEQYEGEHIIDVFESTLLTALTDVVSRLNILHGVTLLGTAKKIKVYLTKATQVWANSSIPFTSLPAANTFRYTGSTPINGNIGCAADINLVLAIGQTPPAILATIETTIANINQTVQIFAADGAGGTPYSYSQVMSFASTGKKTELLISFPLTVSPTTHLRLRLDLIGNGVNSGIGTTTVRIKEFAAIALTPLTLDVEDVNGALNVKRTYYLFWKNSTGGDSQYMFQVNQEMAHTNKSGQRVKRLVLFADGLDYSEWEAINELNQPYETYKNNFTELSSSVVKTGAMTGQQVYIVDTDGSKIGVVVVPQQSRTDSKQERHSIQILIELPEFFE